MSRQILIVCAIAGSTLLASAVRAGSLADPMRPLHAPTKSTAKAPAAPTGARLTAILIGNERRVAVLDGRVVKPGDRVGDLTVQAIDADGVRVLRAGRVETMRLPKQAAAVRNARTDARHERVAQETTP